MDRGSILHYLSDSVDNNELFRKSDEVRRCFCGDAVHVRGIIEFSNHCCRNCLYCGLRRDNTDVNRYRMDEDTIVRRALEIASSGIKTIVLQSGDDFYYTRSILCRIVERIKTGADVAITLSVGERPFEDYRAFKLAGADRYLLKHETASEELYKQLHPHQSLKERLRILNYLREIGYQIGTGNIVGLPGQRAEDLCEDILLMKRLEPDMASVGLFIPQHDTPLANNARGDVALALKVMALVRIVTRNSHMPVTTALVTADSADGLQKGLQVGANVIMPDFTPDRYRKDYTIYDNKTQITLEATYGAINGEHRHIAEDRGDSLKWESLSSQN